MRAFSGLVELPTVIRAHNGVTLYATAAERSASVDTDIAGCMRGSGAVAPNDQWFSKQPD